MKSKQYRVTVVEHAEPVVEANGRNDIIKKIQSRMDVTRTIRVNRIAMSDQDWSSIGLKPDNGAASFNMALQTLFNQAKNSKEAQSLVNSYVGRKYPKAMRNPNFVQVINLMIEITYG